MKRYVLALAAVTALVGAGRVASADAPTREVTMPGKAFAPDRIDVLVGTTVTWRNDDTTNHTVTSAGDVFSSGYVPPGGSFSYTFDRQGRFAYQCTIHKLMRGEVRVFGLVLIGPDEPVVAGRRVLLTGLAPAGTETVTLRAPGLVEAAKPRPDGSFAFGVRVERPAAYRATSGGLVSRAVGVAVRPIVSATRAGRVVRALAAPARPGSQALLQSYDRERFAWRTLRRSRLDRSSRVSFTVPGRPERVRVVVRGSGGWADAASRTIRLREGQSSASG